MKYSTVFVTDVLMAKVGCEAGVRDRCRQGRDVAAHKAHHCVPIG